MHDCVWFAADDPHLSSFRGWGEKETEKARSHLWEVGRPEVKSNSVVDLIFSGNFWPPLGVSFLGAPPDKGSATLFPDGPALLGSCRSLGALYSKLYV